MEKINQAAIAKAREMISSTFSSSSSMDDIEINQVSVKFKTLKISCKYVIV
jgi:hypothetical protein